MQEALRESLCRMSCIRHASLQLSPLTIAPHMQNVPKSGIIYSVVARRSPEWSVTGSPSIHCGFHEFDGQ